MENGAEALDAAPLVPPEDEANGHHSPGVQGTFSPLPVRPGSRFGFWTVIERNSSTTYIVRCVCGRELARQRHALLSGRSRSCGCQKGALMSAKLKGRPPKERKPWVHKSTAGTVPPADSDTLPIKGPVDTWKAPKVKRIRESIVSGVHAIFLGEPPTEVWKHNGVPERGPLYHGREGEEVEVISDTACHCAPCIVVFLRDKFRGLCERHWLRLMGPA